MRHAKTSPCHFLRLLQWRRKRSTSHRTLRARWTFRANATCTTVNDVLRLIYALNRSVPNDVPPPSIYQASTNFLFNVINAYSCQQNRRLFRVTLYEALKKRGGGGFLFYTLTPNFINSHVFWKVPQQRPFVLRGNIKM